MSPVPLHLSIALDGAGWHPAAWREPRARPRDLFGAGYWIDLAQEAERGTIDFITIEDALGLQSTGQVRGRLDAVLIAARVAPATRNIGLVPTATVTHTEPFHVSKAIATLDYVSNGRAGWRVQVSGRPEEAQHFGRRTIPGFRLEEFSTPEVQALAAELFDEAAEFVEVVRRLWDSWEDGAEIRDAATGRFIDRAKLHYIDFKGERFSVKGPSITPRPPQGQPLVTALGHATIPYRLGARAADVLYVTPHDAEQAAAIVAEVRAEQTATGRESLHIFGDLVVFLDETESKAADRKARLDEHGGSDFGSDAAIFIGTPGQLADRLLQWQQAGLTGFRLRPGVLPDDLEAITRGLVPELRRRDAFRHEYEATTLRGLLGLPRPANRYVESR